MWIGAIKNPYYRSGTNASPPDCSDLALGFWTAPSHIHRATSSEPKVEYLSDPFGVASRVAVGVAVRRLRPLRTKTVDSCVDTGGDVTCLPPGRTAPDPGGTKDPYPSRVLGCASSWRGGGG